MRLSRSATEPLNSGPLGFAHRGLHGPGLLVENSVPAFTAAIEHGAGIECDLRLTADEQIMVFHDADARRICDDPAAIGQHTAAQLAHLQVGGCPIPTLRNLLKRVHGRVALLLEVKVAGDRGRWPAALARLLDAYSGAFGVMSFDPLLVAMLNRHRPQWRRGLVIADRLPAWRRMAALYLADPHFLAVETGAAVRPWVAQARTTRAVYCWTVRSRAQRRALQPLTDALIWEADGGP